MTDPGSSKFKYVKWGSTIGAATFLGLSVLFYVQAGNFATALEDEANKCGMPPCGSYDDYNRGLEESGKSRQTLSAVTLVVGVGAAAVAGYFWYKQLTAKNRGETRMMAKTASPEAAWIVVPTVDETSMGASAAIRF